MAASLTACCSAGNMLRVVAAIRGHALTSGHWRLYATSCKDLDSNRQPRLALAPDRSSIICWHPEPEFPYECTQPMPRQEEAAAQGDSPLKVNYLIEEKLKARPDGPTDHELCNMFFTTKHDNEEVQEAKPTHRQKGIMMSVIVYREIASFPSASSAIITKSSGSGGVVNISTVWSQRDIDRKEKTTFGRTYVVDKSKGTVLSVSAPQEINNQLWDVESPSGKYRAVVRKQKDKKDEDKQFIEIWSQKQKLKTIDVQALDKHGDIVGNDSQFGSVQWSQSEGHLLYIAEKKKPKTSSFFTNKPSADDDPKKGEETVKGEEFLYRESWGEQLAERHATVICVMDVEAGTVSVLETVPDDVSPGQAIWGPDDAGVVFVGWFHEPYRLGLRFCVQRRKSANKFLTFLIPMFAERLSSEGRAVRCPLLSPDQKRLIFLDTPEGGPHNRCSRVLMCEWEKRQAGSSVVVDVVNSAGAGEFPGVFSWAVLTTSRVWLSDNVHIVLPTNWRSQAAVVLVNTQTGQKCLNILRVSTDALGMATSVLDVCGNLLVLSCSSPNRPFYLVYGTLDLSQISSTCWIPLDSDSETVQNIECRIIRHTPTQDRTHPKYGSLDYESLLYLPKTPEGAGKPPLILFPHGGPHSAFDSSFALIPAVFCRCGFAVLAVNFRGSIGFGQDNIQSLLERIGDQDVKDCK
ncbi:hypothetical protein BaRGS_00008759, partial [Batillaria attramentaria]